MEQEKQVKRILVLGGSSFVGLTLMRELSSYYQQKNQDVQEPYEWEVYYINRGKGYWGNKVKSFPGLIYINGNRKEKEEFEKLLEYTSKKLKIGKDNKWESVIDMCAFKWQNIRSVYQGLKGLVKQYIFVSTDSVYDVCRTDIRGESYKKMIFTGEYTDSAEFQGERIKEEYDQRLLDSKERKRAKEDEGYGHAKLMCEEYMNNEIKKEEFPYIIVRFADVIGPYDDTGRFWAYVKWIMEYNNSVPIPQDSETTRNLLSFVYSEDIVRLFMQMIQNADKYLEQNKLGDENCPLFKSYNLACDQNVTLEEMINAIFSYIPEDKRNSKVLKQEKVQSAPAYFPSVDCGPIEIQRAKQIFNWQPTHILQAVKSATQFFVQAQVSGQYKSESKYADQKLSKKMKK